MTNLAIFIACRTYELVLELHVVIKGIIYTKYYLDSLYFKLKILDTMLIHARKCIKIRIVLHTLFLSNEVRDPHFFISETIHYYPLSIKVGELSRRTFLRERPSIN